MVPVAGSAYTYAYATLGELFAWIIGWDLVLEYAVASATVAHGWSHYFQNFLGLFGMHVARGAEPARRSTIDPRPDSWSATGHVWSTCRRWWSRSLVTVVLVNGIRESASFNAAMVVVKLAVVLFVIVVGVGLRQPGQLDAVRAVRLAGISFFGHTIAGQTGAGGEPLGMLAGAADDLLRLHRLRLGLDARGGGEEPAARRADRHHRLAASSARCSTSRSRRCSPAWCRTTRSTSTRRSPSAFAARRHAVGAAADLARRARRHHLGAARADAQPAARAARDGARRPGAAAASSAPSTRAFRTPWKSTILTGVFVALLGGFLPLRILAELVNIGTLLAFVIVCGAVLVLRRTHPELPRPFRCPWVPFVPIAGIVLCLMLMFSLPVENWLRLVIWLRDRPRDLLRVRPPPQRAAQRRSALGCAARLT